MSIPIHDVFAQGLEHERLQSISVDVLKHGVTLLRGAFNTSDINAWHEDFQTRILRSVNAGAFPYRIWNLGPGRTHYIVEIHKSFATPAFYANPWIYNVTSLLLEHEFVMATCAVAHSVPGAGKQYIHRDQPLPTRNDRLNRVIPPFSLTVAIPLVSTNEDCGGTEFVIGSHVEQSAGTGPPVFGNASLKPGDCLIWDSRTLHRGMENYSNQSRPLLLLYYQRPWFFNFLNYSKDCEIKISGEALSCVSEGYRHLFEWAHKVFRPPSFAALTSGDCGCGSGLPYERCHAP